MIHEAKLTNLAEELAKATAQVWGSEIEPATDYHRARATLWRLDGLRLHVGTVDNRLRINWDLHAPAYRVNGKGYGPDARRYDETDYPAITCSPDKTSTQIAGDIRRRLLPKAEEFHRRAVYLAQTQRAKLDEAALFLEVLKSRGLDVGPHNCDSEKWTARGKVKKWDLYIGPWTRELKLHGLNDAQILAVIDALEATPGD
jgi:hypothetical protein